MEKCLAVKYCYTIVSRRIDAKRNGCDKISNFFRTLNRVKCKRKRKQYQLPRGVKSEMEQWKEKRTFNANEMNTMLDVHEIRIEERSNIRISNRNSSNSSNKWIKVSDAVTLWTRSNERQWRGEQERKNKHFQQSALRNRKREGKGGDHTLEFNRNTAHSTIISIYVFAFSAHSSTHVMLETKLSVSQPVCIRM